MKHTSIYILLATILGFCFGCIRQTPNDNLLGNDRASIVEKEYDDSLMQIFFSCANFSQINQFIDTEMKLTVLYANGCYPQYERLDSLCEDAKSYNLPDWVIDDLFNAFDFSNISVDSLFHTNAPIFDGEKILQQGAFIDESDGKKIMSSVIGNLIQVEKIEMNDKDYIKALENDSSFYSNMEDKTIRVILTNADSECPIRIFHFTTKNNKLYLTLIDLYSYDTSA